MRDPDRRVLAVPYEDAMRRPNTLAASPVRKGGSTAIDLLVNLIGACAGIASILGLNQITAAIARRGYAPQEVALIDLTLAGVLAVVLGLAWWGLPHRASLISSWLCLSMVVRIVWTLYVLVAPHLAGSIG
jgi:uncharacterized membrane protein